MRNAELDIKWSGGLGTTAVVAPRAAVTNPRQGRRRTRQLFSGRGGVREANVNCRAWLIREARTVLLWLRSSCLDANEGHRSSGHLSARLSARRALGCRLVEHYTLSTVALE